MSNDKFTFEDEMDNDNDLNMSLEDLWEEEELENKEDNSETENQRDKVKKLQEMIELRKKEKEFQNTDIIPNTDDESIIINGIDISNLSSRINTEIPNDKISKEEILDDSEETFLIEDDESMFIPITTETEVEFYPTNNDTIFDDYNKSTYYTDDLTKYDNDTQSENPTNASLPESESYEPKRTRYSSTDKNVDVDKKSNGRKKLFLIGGGSVLVLSLGLSIGLLFNNDKKDTIQVSEPNETVDEPIEPNKNNSIAEEPLTELGVSDDGTSINTVPAQELKKSSVYEKDLSSHIKMDLSMVNDSGLVIPTTVLITKEKVLKDLGTTSVTQMQLYERYGANLNEQALGFVDYHPFKGILYADENTKTITLVMDKEAINKYDGNETSNKLFLNSFIDTFGKTYQHLKLENSEGDGYVLSQYRNDSVSNSLINDLSGLISQQHAENNNEEQVKESTVKLMDIKQGGYSYYLYVKGENRFLSPGYGQSYTNLTDALLSMRSSTSNGLTSVIPSGITYSVVEEGSRAIVKFNEKFDLSKYSTREVLALLEGLSLTGAGFNKTILLENVEQTEWKDYDLRKELPKPVGANKISLN